MSDRIGGLSRQRRRQGRQASRLPTAQARPARIQPILVAVLIGAIMVAPLVALEVSRMVGPDGAPDSGLAMIAVLWALLTLAVFLAWSLARRLRGDDVQ